MKKIIYILAFIIATVLHTNAQSNIPNSINLQAIARTNSGAIVNDTNIQVRLSFYPNSTLTNLLVQKIYLTRTDAFGQFQIDVDNGGGFGQVGSVANISNIDWSTGNIYILLEYQYQIGPNYTIIDTVKAGTTFYSFASRTAEVLKTSGNNGDILKYNGTAWVSYTPQIPTVTRITANTGFPYTPPSGVKYIIVEMVGGGGGGSTFNTFPGGGGGAGGYLKFLISNPSSSYSYSIGSGGAANTNGGNTSFGSNVAGGGKNPGQVGNHQNGGPGGTNTFSLGTLIIDAAGGGGSATMNINSTTIPGGNGGSSFFGGSGRSINDGGVTGGNGEINTGGGGAGGGYAPGPPILSSTGGAGGSGVIIIYEYYQ
ncbi:MAG TPA: hypothetical protein PLI68_07850 [Bacteroidia bacterium]|nr:hypothetical protein [Bacteroidia bacterium]